MQEHSCNLVYFYVILWFSSDVCDRAKVADPSLQRMFSRARHTQVSCMKGYASHETPVFFPALENQQIGVKTKHFQKTSLHIC